MKWLLTDIFTCQQPSSKSLELSVAYTTRIYMNKHWIQHYNTNATITVTVTSKNVFSVNKTLQRNSSPSAPSNHQTMCNCVLCKHCKTYHTSKPLANPPKASLGFLSISLMFLYIDLSFVMRFIDTLRGQALFFFSLSITKVVFSWSHDKKKVCCSPFLWSATKNNLIDVCQTCSTTV